ncbi:hypothetical protein GCM10010109_41380 [Actinoplanes campanulatus]|nr:hypothetical protein GCM10010109_41380 [Actinoplanes campanulatus]GID39451.1 hypothetical protein Aca09nite_59570 [Actinoplanes campanulatus]
MPLLVPPARCPSRRSLSDEPLTANDQDWGLINLIRSVPGWPGMGNIRIRAPDPQRVLAERRSASAVPGRAGVIVGDIGRPALGRPSASCRSHSLASSTRLNWFVRAPDLWPFSSWVATSSSGWISAASASDTTAPRSRGLPQLSLRRCACLLYKRTHETGTVQPNWLPTLDQAVNAVMGQSPVPSRLTIPVLAKGPRCPPLEIAVGLAA